MEKSKKPRECRLCPRECGADLSRDHGYCGTGTSLEVAAVAVHHGEEPVISGGDGICNIFFSGCNLRCIYCQNHQISRRTGRVPAAFSSMESLIARITTLLATGIENIGFVSPSHRVPQVMRILEALHRRGYHPIVVYNTNAYEKVDTLRLLEGLVDVYLPDLKYMDGSLSARWSAAADYPEVARAAVKEMYRQKGNRLFYTDSGKLRSGMIVRHLVLPEGVANGIAVFRFLAEELSTRLAVSLMSQYHPIPDVAGRPPLDRYVTPLEYRRIAAEIERLGFETGWLQGADSAGYYCPDFALALPFRG